MLDPKTTKIAGRVDDLVRAALAVAVSHHAHGREGVLDADLDAQDNAAFLLYVETGACPLCWGSGRVDGEKCRACGGEG